ncbi:MAG: NUDIX hydrolase [Nanoarchaeota archaeon]
MVFVSAGIILKDKKIFLVKRVSSEILCPNTWICPGGTNEFGESKEQTLKREVKEEVNLDFKEKELFFTMSYFKIPIYTFLGDFKGNIKLDEKEICDSGWFSYEEAIKLDLGFEYRKVIEKLKEERKIY